MEGGGGILSSEMDLQSLLLQAVKQPLNMWVNPLKTKFTKLLTNSIPSAI